MAQRPSSLTKEDLVSATLPPATATYTVISHDFAITTIKEELEANGFTIEKEEYRGTAGAKVANGLFVITYGEDPDLAMSYSFTNSYDKSARFRAAIGAYVKANDSVIIANMDFWKRKHTGTADSETKELIKEHMSDAKRYFDQLAKDKEAMKQIEIDKGTYGSILGQLFIEGYLTTEQFSLAAREYLSPTQVYTTGANNLWTCYNHIIVALRQTHPAKWLQYQGAVHMYFAVKFNLMNFDEEDEELEDVTEEELTAIGDRQIAYEKGELENDPEEEVDDEGFDNTTIDDMEDLEKEEPKHSIVGVEGAHQFHPDHAADEEADNIKLDEAMEEQEEESPFHDEQPMLPGFNKPAEESPVEAYPEDWDQSEGDYFSAEDYPGVKIDDVIEVEEKYYTITATKDVEGDLYLVGVEMVIEATEETETAVEEPQTSLEFNTEEVIEEEADVEFEETVEEVEDSTDTIDPLAKPKKEEEVEEEEVEDPDPELTAVIAAELEDLFGVSRKFKYTKEDGQYNVVIPESGETVTLPVAYIDSL